MIAAHKIDDTPITAVLVGVDYSHGQIFAVSPDHWAADCTEDELLDMQQAGYDCDYIVSWCGMFCQKLGSIIQIEAVPESCYHEYTHRLIKGAL